MIQFDDHIFQMGWNHQLDYKLNTLFEVFNSIISPEPLKKAPTDKGISTGYFFHNSYNLYFSYRRSWKIPHLLLSFNLFHEQFHLNSLLSIKTRIIFTITFFCILVYR